MAHQDGDEFRCDIMSQVNESVVLLNKCTALTVCYKRIVCLLFKLLTLNMTH